MKWKVRLGACRVFPNCSTEPAQHPEPGIEALISGMVSPPRLAWFTGRHHLGISDPYTSAFCGRQYVQPRMRREWMRLNRNLSGCRRTQLASTRVVELGAQCRPAAPGTLRWRVAGEYTAEVFADWLGISAADPNRFATRASSEWHLRRAAALRVAKGWVKIA